jgi:hypothetical protein
MTPEQCAEIDAERQEWQRKQQAERIERLLADDDAHQKILCDRTESGWFKDQSEKVNSVIQQLEPVLFELTDDDDDILVMVLQILAEWHAARSSHAEYLIARFGNYVRRLHREFEIDSYNGIRFRFPPQDREVEDSGTTLEIIEATANDAGVTVEYNDATFRTHGFSVSALGTLAGQLIEAGAPPHADLLVDGFYYTLRQLARCADAIHIRNIDSDDEGLIKQMNGWLKQWAEAHPQTDAPWRSWNDQLCGNVVGVADVLIEFADDAAGRDAETAFRESFGSDDRLSFPSGPHGRRPVMVT